MRADTALPSPTEYAEPPLRLTRDAVRYDHRENSDGYGQARALFRADLAGGFCRLRGQRLDAVVEASARRLRAKFPVQRNGPS